MAEEGIQVTITSKQANAALLVGSLFLGLPAGYGLFIDPAPDRYTGTQGASHELRTSELEHWRNTHLQWSRTKSIENRGKYERHEAQIQELYRHIGHP